MMSAGRARIGLLAVGVITLGLFIVHFSGTLTGWPFRLMVTAGQSMEPTFRALDLLLVYQARPETLRVGDIIAYKPDPTHEVIVHRIVEESRLDGRPVFITKGDALSKPDDWHVEYGWILGKVSQSVPALGALFIQPMNYAVTLLSILAIILGLRPGLLSGSGGFQTDLILDEYLVGFMGGAGLAILLISAVVLQLIEREPELFAPFAPSLVTAMTLGLLVFILSLGYKLLRQR